MRFRTTAARLGAAAAAVCAVTLFAPATPPAVADSVQLTASPGAAKPGVAVVVSGTIPAEAGQPFSVEQIYTNGSVARVTANGSPGVADAKGHVTTTVTIPTGAARSDILRPYGSWQYDVVSFQFGPGCPVSPKCTTYGVNVNVLPISTAEHITLSTLSPRTGSTLGVRATNCVGGILVEFARVIDGNGVYFPFTGQQAGTTFTGSADLSHGFRGKDSPQGAANVSRPVGIRDTYAAVPCAQSEGPASVAAADHLEHLTMVIDITICPRTGTCRISSAVAPAGQAAVVTVPRSADSQTVVPAAAPPARPVRAEPTFVG